MEYFNEFELRQEILKQIPIDQIKKRATIKKALSVPKMINKAMENQDKVMFKDGISYFEKKTFQSALKNIININDFNISNPKDEFTADKLEVYQKIKDFYVDFNSLRKPKPKQKKTFEEIEKGIRTKTRKRNQELKDALNSNKKIIIFDVELYEKDKNILTEVGILIIEKNNIKKLEHLIIEENKEIKNGKYVADNKNNFNQGKSKVVNQEEAIKELEKDLLSSHIILGHGIFNDLKYLKRNYENLYEKTKQKQVIDTAPITKLLDENLQAVGIERCLKKFNIQYENLHNAGNDVFYNFKILSEIIRFNDKELNLQPRKNNKFVK